MRLDIPNELETQWLISQGVSEKAMLEPHIIRAGRVRFLDGNTFEFADEGERALVFRVVECDCEVDLVAWSRKRNQLATWRGKAFALGQEAIWNPATYFMGSALEIHETPINWLKAEREGICIVQPRFAYANLGHVERILCHDEKFARDLERWLQPPQPRAEILVEVSA